MIEIESVSNEPLINNNEAEQVLSTKEASIYLKLSVATIQKLVETGMLKAWKTKGGHRRILKSSLLEYASKSNNLDYSESQKLSVLIVEDNIELSTLYQLKIVEWNLDINLKVVNSGIEGLIQLGKSRPDILILDLKMRGIDGFQLLKILEKDNSMRCINIIVVTGMIKSEIKGKIPSDILILEKPINFDFLHGYFAAKLSSKSGL